MILFFVGCIQLFFLGSRAGVPHLGFVFFVWVGIFSLTTIAQFWSYANEIYRAPEAAAVPADRGRLDGGRAAGGGPGRTALRAGREPVRDDADRGRRCCSLHLALYRVVEPRVSAGRARPSRRRR